MNNKPPSVLFSRILLIIGGLTVIGLAYWFINTSLAPVAAPPAAARRQTVRFDPALDISKNEVFFRLRSLAPASTTLPALGRPNPFIPVVRIPAATSSPETPGLPSASGTAPMVSSTQP